MNDGGGSWEGFPSYQDRLARVEQQLAQEPASPAGRPREREVNPARPGRPREREVNPARPARPARPGRPCERELRELEAKNAENARLRKELKEERERLGQLEKQVAELQRQLEDAKRPYRTIRPYGDMSPYPRDQGPGGPGFGP